jgi:hypothetical protein
MMEAVHTAETSVHFSVTTRRYISKYSNLQSLKMAGIFLIKLKLAILNVIRIIPNGVSYVWIFTYCTQKNKFVLFIHNVTQWQKQPFVWDQ